MQKHSIRMANTFQVLVMSILKRQEGGGSALLAAVMAQYLQVPCGSGIHCRGECSLSRLSNSDIYEICLRKRACASSRLCSSSSVNKSTFGRVSFMSSKLKDSCTSRSSTSLSKYVSMFSSIVTCVWEVRL